MAKIPLPDYRHMAVDIDPNENYFKTLQRLKEYYLDAYNSIMAHHEKGSLSHYRVYPCDWSTIHTPIEFAAWSSIRAKGRTPLYPQFPVDRYFVDFANPYYRIGVELDGKEWHNADKDRERDTHLAQLGWKIFRITGAEMYRTDYEWHGDLFTDWNTYDEDFQKMRHWLMNTGDGVIEAVRFQYFGRDKPYTPDEYDGLFEGTVMETLHKHSLTRII